MRVGTIATSRPRIFLIDFETAHAFDSDCSRENAVLTGLPCGGSVQSTQRYTRPTVPEMKAGTAYDPFKVDVWQLGASISDFKVGTPCYTSRLPRLNWLPADYVP